MCKNTETGKDYLSHISIARVSICERLLYLSKKNPEEKKQTFALQKFITKRTSYVKQRFYQEFKNSIKVENHIEGNNENKEAAFSDTKKLLNKGKTVFKGCFIYDYFYCKIDVAEPTKKGLNIYIVASGSNVNRSMVKNAAIQYWIVEKAGFKVNSVRVASLDSKFEFGDPKNSLFEITDITEEVKEHLGGVEKKAEKAKSILLGDELPKASMNLTCFKPKTCSFFHKCFPDALNSSIFEIGGVELKLKIKLFKKGFTKIEQLHVLDDLEPFVESQVESRIEHKIQVKEGLLKNELEKLKFPAVFFDTESFQPAIPLLKGTSPFQQVPVHYSAFRLNKADDEPEYHFFTGKPGEDFRKDLLVHFLEQTENIKSLVCFNKASEKRTLKQLAKRYPQYTTAIEDRVKIIYDIAEVFEKGFVYHPDMKGSTSLKAITGALFEEHFYQDLDIHEGGEVAFTYEMLYYDKEIDEKEVLGKIERYCRIDALILLDIFNYLKELVHEK